TEKLMSLILSDTTNIRSIMGGKSKKLIKVWSSAHEGKLKRAAERRVVRRALVHSKTASILAHNQDKRKQILFIVGTNSP
ncbi:MAG TPA: hypothetical protein VL907_10660, partial [Pyrinomonadaceae bacterium]|nr:hypothetical protein [Pyrinomonadaceae bacterium]